MDEKYTSLLPLILFTALLPMAIGLEVGATLTCLSTDISTENILTVLLWSLGLIILSGILVSLHLSHVKRSMIALRGVIHSFLSREILFTCCFVVLLVAGIICAYIKVQGIIFPALLGVGCGWGLVTAYAIGRVYDLPAQITWRGVGPSLGPVIASILTALSIYYVLTGSFEPQVTVGAAFLLILALDVLFTIKRIREFTLLRHSQYLLAYPQLKTTVKLCYTVKLTLTVIIIILFIAKHYNIILLFIILQILLDRIAFYASAARKTPKANIAAAKDERMRAALNS